MKKIKLIMMGTLCLVGTLLGSSGTAQASLCQTCAYVTANGGIYSWDPVANTLTLVVASPSPALDSLFFDPNGNIVFDTDDTNSIYLYNPTSQTLTTLVSNLGSNLGDMALEPSGGSLLVSSRNSGTIYRVDLNTKATQVFYHSSLSPAGIIYDNAGRLFAVLGNTVAQLDPASGAILKSVSAPNGPDGMSFSTTTMKIYVGSSAGFAGFYTIPTDLSSAIYTDLKSTLQSGQMVDGTGVAGNYLYMAVNAWGACPTGSLCGNLIQYDLTAGHISSVSPQILNPDDIAPLSGLGSVNPAPTITFSANPTTINSGNSSILKWTIINANNASIDQSIGSISPTSGTVNVSPTHTTTYTLTATGPGGTSSAQATVTVTSAPPPPPKLGSIVLTPLAARRIPGQTIQFNAQGYDTNGNPMAISSFAWAIQSPAGSTIDSSGFYTAGSAVLPSTDTITVSSGAISSQAIVVVDNPSPTLTIQSISAIPNPVTNGTMTLASVVATSSANDITYSWTFTGPTGVGFDTPNSATTHATFSSPGTYTLTVTILSQSMSLSASVVVNVIQTVNQVIVSPANVAIQAGQTFSFTKTVLDQWGHPMPNEQVNWSSTAGTMNAAAGTFFSPSPISLVTVRATSVSQPTVSGTATLSVEGAGPSAFDISNAHAHPVPWRPSLGVNNITFTGLAPNTSIRIFTTDGHRVATLQSINGEDKFWFLLNDGGERVASGVYLYLIDNSDGSQRVKGKLVVLQ